MTERERRVLGAVNDQGRPGYLAESRAQRLAAVKDPVVGRARRDVDRAVDDPALSENTGRNEGLAYDHAMRALQTLLASPRLAGMTIAELNPDHAEQNAHSIERFAAAISGSVASAPAIKHS